MPLYEYSCLECGHCFEELVRSSETNEETPVCPACGSWETERRMSAFSTPSGGQGDALGSFHPSGGSCGTGGFS